MEDNSIKITGVKAYLFHPYSSNKAWIIRKHWLFIKIETDQGIEGWGEAFTIKNREHIIAEYVEELANYLLGRNPFHIKHFTQWAFNDFSERRGGVDLFSAVSGIEQALWDIVGKQLGVPVFNLLGGPCRDKIRVYANGFSSGASTPQEIARRSVEVVNLGFNAIKIYPFLNGEDEKRGIDNIRAVRKAVGSDIDVLIDIWRLPSPIQAIRVAKAVEELNVFWYEEPVPSNNLEVLKEVKNSIELPVVTGECLYTKFEFRSVLEKQAADILNPDVASCGGILELKEIAAMAEPYYVSIAPHNFNSTAVALAATLQLSATIPNFLIAEYFVSFSEAGNVISLNPFKVEDGYIRIPQKPGLGIEVDESALKKHPFQKFP